MKKPHLLWLVFFVTVCTTGFGQSITHWKRHFGSASNDGGQGLLDEFGTNIAHNSVGEVFVVTQVAPEAVLPGGIGLGDYDGWLVKLTRWGDTLWTKRIGGEGWDKPQGLIATDDGGVLMVGSTASRNLPGYRGNLDGWVVRFNAAGQILWERAFGGSRFSDAAGIEELYDVQRTPQGNFVFVGKTTNFNLFEVQPGDTISATSDGWLFVLDDQGNKLLHTRSFNQETTPGYPYSVPRFPYFDYLNEYRSVVPLPNNKGYLALGNTGFFNDPADLNFFLTRFDSRGRVVWQRTLGSDGWDEGRKVLALPNGDILIGGLINGRGRQVTDTTYGQSDMWFARLDSTGQTIRWNKTFGNTRADVLEDMFLTNNNNTLVIVGRSDFLTADSTLADGVLLKVNVSDGELQSPVTRYVGNKQDAILSCVYDAVLDNYLMVCRSTSDAGYFDVNTGDYDLWVLRTGGERSSYSETQPEVYFYAEENRACVDQLITFRNRSRATRGTLRWTFSDGGTSQDTTPAYAFMRPGVYDVTLQIGSLSLTRRGFIRIDTIAQPTVSIEKLNWCLGDKPVATVRNPVSGLIYTWYKDTAIAAQGVRVEIPSAGTYRVSATGVGNCINYSDPFTIRINPTPRTPQITQHGDTLKTASGMPFYRWYRNDQFLSQVNKPQFIPPVSGRYRVEVEDMNGCVARSAEYNYFRTGRLDSRGTLPVVIYPNPVVCGQQLTVSLPNGIAKAVNYWVVDATGRVVQQGLLDPQTGTMKIDALPAGVYELRFDIPAGQCRFIIIDR